MKARLALAVVMLGALPAMAQPLIFAHDARANIGRQVTVRGTVQRVQHVGASTYLYLEGHNRQSAVLVRLDADSAATFPDLDSYAGRTLDVSGLVQSDRGTPEIIVLRHEQLMLK